MCGIAGKYNFDGAPVDRALLTRMADAIRHRGPDEGGLYASGPFGMAMRRLSIIDLESGRQPLSNEDGSIWIAFNGEIYNYVELRDNLRARGHRFRTGTDTEVVVHLYEEQADRCIDALRGMFAFAVWDDRTRTLMLARDRLGEKPLFYAVVPRSGLVFGSELKALLEDPSVERTIDLEALDAYVNLLYIPGGLSIFRQVRKLPAGHLLVATPRGIRVRQYWDVPVPTSEPRAGAPDRTAVGQFQERLREAVGIQLRSDVPLGAFLSGGVDSSAVVATMADLMHRPVVTASIGFEEAGYSELPYAKLVARHIHSDHHERIVRAPAPELIEKIVWHLDEPFGDSSAIPTYFVSMAARDRVTVALSGDGGDELFAGYARHRFETLEHRIRRIAGAAGVRALSGAAALLPEGAKGRNMLRRLALSPEEACARKFPLSAVMPELSAGLYSGDLRHATAQFDVLAPFKQAFRRAAGADPLSRILYVDLKTSLPDDMLTKVDRMSMAHSLEVRAPLLDHKLVEYMALVPPRWKLAGRTTKVLLRAALDGTVPRGAFDRKKHGFVSPIGRWLRTGLAAYVNETICSPRALARGYFEPRIVRHLWDAHRSGRANFEHEIWMLLVLEVWHRVFVDRTCPAGGNGRGWILGDRQDDPGAPGGRVSSALRGSVDADRGASGTPVRNAGVRVLRA